MNDAASPHSHAFLGERHAQAERNVWATVALTLAMMAIEIVGGAWFGSLALIADGFHMSTHAGALAVAALAYTMARRRADDPRFTFGTGKFGDLAGFSSALVLAVIALEIGWEALERLLSPRPVAFAQAIPIAALGLVVNIASAWLLSRGGHHHHGAEPAHDEAATLAIGGQTLRLAIHEDGATPRFRLEGAHGDAVVETLRPDGARQRFAFIDRGPYRESIEQIPEPHEFEAVLTLGDGQARTTFAEHNPLHRDHNMRAALVHVLADAAVSALVIVGLALAYVYGWLFLDPLAALAGAGVIGSWAYQLVRDTGAVLLDANPDMRLSEKLRNRIGEDGDVVTDLHLWRLGPGHLGAIVAVATTQARDAAHYRHMLAGVARFSHLTIEVARGEAPARSQAA